MDEPEQPKVNEQPAPDFVVIDRKMLRQTLEAVLNTLKSTISFELLTKNQVINPEQQNELHQQLVNSRGALITGIKQMLDTVDSMPSIKINEQND